MGAPNLRKLAKNWEGLARRDALGAILTDPSKSHGKWDQEEFFATGRREVEMVMACVRSLGLQPDPARAALDFGCGVGRLTQALAGHFQRCVGVDISPTMVELATKANLHPGGCTFLVNDSNRLAQLEDDSFGFVYTNIVLQHVDPELVEGYLREFIRVLGQGGILVFQMPDRSKATAIQRVRQALQLRTNLRRVMAAFGFGEKPYVMQMHSLPEAAVRELLARMPTKLVDVRLTNATRVDYNGKLEYLAAEPGEGLVSKQYCAVRT